MQKNIKKADNVLAAVSIDSNRLTKGSRSIYSSKVKAIIIYFLQSGLQHYLVKVDGIDAANAIDGDVVNAEDWMLYDLNLDTITWTQLSEFFGSITKGADNLMQLKDEPGSEGFVDFINTNTIYATETVSGYASAFKNLFKDSNKLIAKDLNEHLLKHIEGYKKTVAALKSKGKWTMSEGKRHIKPAGFKILVSPIIQTTH